MTLAIMTTPFNYTDQVHCIPGEPAIVQHANLQEVLSRSQIACRNLELDRGRERQMGGIGLLNPQALKK